MLTTVATTTTTTTIPFLFLLNVLLLSSVSIHPGLGLLADGDAAARAAARISGSRLFHEAVNDHSPLGTPTTTPLLPPPSLPSLSATATLKPR
ncbi:hypothetical protein WN55_07168 [Dufourea novaeangliae]|uniref:Uncharacterized protein n=1 Tax=Dufourea novaeangliae TaxID=178035 RepID=A0A154P2M3_DUFNO|nr:hypothetical protein WN55_07168 [Dufourea novaeangliae]